MLTQNDTEFNCIRKRLSCLFLVSTTCLISHNSIAQTQSDTRDVNLSSWHTGDASRYARIFETYEDEQAGNAVTTWDNGTYAQTLPAYSGVQKIQYSDDYVYLTTTGLAAGHTMGPWYNDTGPGGSEEVFQNWPEAIENTFRFANQPVIPNEKSTFPAGAIGLMIDGTIIFSSSDTFSWDGSNGVDTGPGQNANGMGTGVWNHDAYITESNTFDRSNSHAAGNQLHYHATPQKLRHLLGDSMDAVLQANGAYAYVENFNGQHSPIIGWLNDGFPLYGPYGYTDPDPSSTDTSVSRMRSGFVLRDGNNGTYDIATNGRDRLPDWAAVFQGIGPNLSGTDLGPSNDEIPIPYFMEDYAYLGDLIDPNDGLPYIQGIDFDLNQYNVRWCRTPEFPEGTWAYFTCIDEAGNPTFPYNVAVEYYGDPSQGGTVTTIEESASLLFTGGPDGGSNMQSITPDLSGNSVTIVWSAVEGGTYMIQSSDNLSQWSDSSNSNTANDNQLETVETLNWETTEKRFYRLTQTSLADYDTGAGNGGGAGGGGGDGMSIEAVINVNPSTGNGIVTVTFSLNSTIMPPPPPNQIPPQSVTLGGVAGTSVSRNGTSGDITATFNLSSLSTGSYDIIATFNSPNGTINFTGTNVFTVTN